MYLKIPTPRGVHFSKIFHRGCVDFKWSSPIDTMKKFRSFFLDAWASMCVHNLNKSLNEERIAYILFLLYVALFICLHKIKHHIAYLREFSFLSFPLDNARTRSARVCHGATSNIPSYTEIALATLSFYHQV